MPETIPERAERIDALLPQTQCTRCGYPDCRSYAGALASGEADVNQCPPGGESTMQALADLLHRAGKPVDPARGIMPVQPEVACVDESNCIGCFKCVLVCPVDAIVGAPKLMHTVIAVDCSGCELCLPVCPTDCITMVPRAASVASPAELAPRWRALYRTRTERRARERRQRDDVRRQRAGTALKDRAASFDIAAAITRGRSRHSSPQGSDTPDS